MNRTIIRLAARAILGGKRVWLLAALGLVLIAIGVATRLIVPDTSAASLDALRTIAFGTFLPLFGLIVGTGVIGPEIDDGSIVHLLSKPVSRHTIVQSKLAVALLAIVVFAVLPVAIAAAIIEPDASIVVAYGVGALCAGAVYSVVFLLLAIITRHAVVIGLVYALVWESLVGSLIPGARNVSVQQWALSVTSSIAPEGTVDAGVGIGLAWVLIAAVVAVGTWYAGARLRVLVLTSED